MPRDRSSIGGAEYAKLGVENSTGHARLLALRQRRATAATTSSPLGTTLRELIYDLGGGIPDGRELKAVIPGGSSVPVLTADQIDTPLDFDSLAEAGSMLGSGARDRDRRPLLHGAARPAGRAVLHARVVRQVHAVPRGHALDGADPATRSRTATPSRASSTCCSTSATASSASASARSATRRRCRSRATSTSSATSSRRTSTQGGCPFGGESSLEGVLAPVDQHTHHPTAEVPA